MAAGTVQHKKYASGSGEEQFVDIIGILGGDTPTDQLVIYEVRVRKDIYDQLAASQKTALDAVTLGNIVTQAFS